MWDLITDLCRNFTSCLFGPIETSSSNASRNRFGSFYVILFKMHETLSEVPVLNGARDNNCKMYHLTIIMA